VSLVSQAYTSITLQDFARYVGLPENESAVLALQQSGTHDIFNGD
jgi:hypothetical protein